MESRFKANIYCNFLLRSLLRNRGNGQKGMIWFEGIYISIKFAITTLNCLRYQEAS